MKLNVLFKGGEYDGRMVLVEVGDTIKVESILDINGHAYRLIETAITRAICDGRLKDTENIVVRAQYMGVILDKK